ncbi:MAG: FAD-dependent oxidoreductase [candidate division WOR-3 bacterium]|nr:MAG: FAD-dependent oxidoreductase [candidate division WOR-3 bacterium]
MNRLESAQELKRLQEKLGDTQHRDRPTIVVSSGTCGRSRGSDKVLAAFEEGIRERKLQDKVNLRDSGCHGFCQAEPNVVIFPEETFYANLKPEDAAEILDETIGRGKVVDRLLYTDPGSGAKAAKLGDVAFYEKQNRLVSGRNVLLDPTRIEDYLAIGGYSGLAKALAMEPGAVTDEVVGSGLRGRGGGGFPTGLKWQRIGQAEPKYIVCNADEGDPGAYMDRGLLEGNPHCVLEGMIIGAYAIGAAEGVVYVRTEYPLAVANVTRAIEQARDLGLLGEDILGSGFGFDISIARGAGAFVCGEETALIASIEGRMGEPRQRPPYPSEKGLWGKPTIVNNVETWASVGVVLEHGAEKFASVGTDTSKGTKIFSLVGRVNNTGLVEVPMGITLREVIFDIGGGIPDNRKFKAVQTGGPSGGCIPAEQLDLPIDYESLTEAGAMMGSGGMIVMDDRTCMVDIARYFLNFLQDESCGKCFSCREGTQRLYEVVSRIAEGRGREEDLGLLDELARAVKDASMCGLGRTAGNPVLTTLRYFRNEYERHIRQKKCDSYVCKELVGAPCASACPVGTEAWRYIAHISRGEYEEAYRAIREPNPFPSICARVCHHPCEMWCRAGEGGNRPVAIRALKRFVTDRVDPGTYRPERVSWQGAGTPAVAVVGAGPAGLTAAHCLALAGCKVTVYEAAADPGGMLSGCIPAYRLPKDVLKKEIDALVDENVTIKFGVSLGRDLDVESLLADGFKAVFLAFGAHKSRNLGIEGEQAGGVFHAVDFLKAFNLRGESLARGKVGVVGGGNSAIDAARVALRQEGVEAVTIFYRRTRAEMPAIDEETEAALCEGVELVTLVSPARVVADKDGVDSLVLTKNTLGDADSSGRRQPVPVPGSDYVVPVDTLIVAIGETPDTDAARLAGAGIKVRRNGTLEVDPETLMTSRPGVFAGGDVVTGPNMVVDAVAAGKKAAESIGRHLRGEPLAEPPVVHLPEVYVPPVPAAEDEEFVKIERVEPPKIPPDLSCHTFEEVETAISAEGAAGECRRCLRCDLEFTEPKPDQAAVPAAAGSAK